MAAVVLAAGESTRMGRVKQLIEYDGEPLVRRATRSALEAGAKPVAVVLGANASLIAPALADLQDVISVTNDRWQEGQASSLVAGLRAAPANADGVLVTLSDQPLVDAAALRLLIAAFVDGSRIVAASYEGIIGVPAVFGTEYLDQLLELTGDRGAGQWLRARRAEVRTVSIAAASVDIDTLDDVRRLDKDLDRT